MIAYTDSSKIRNAAMLRDITMNMLKLTDEQKLAMGIKSAPAKVGTKSKKKKSSANRKAAKKARR